MEKAKKKIFEKEREIITDRKNKGEKKQTKRMTKKKINE